ncbi:MAG: Sec-independent protein translocase protein TatB [Alphaproteobacteria bacterium]|nr:Sec-independent protein translocase protein TatB [Alphaproteobacteria bacterium]
MFDLSFSEILLIVLVAVVFLGPKELPTVIRAVARALRVLKNLSMEVRKTFEALAEESGIANEIKMIQGDDGKWYESYPTQNVMPAKAGSQPEKTLDPGFRRDDGEEL